MIQYSPKLGFSVRKLPIGRNASTQSACVGWRALENMLVVTKTGAEIMDYFPREQISIAPR